MLNFLENGRLAACSLGSDFCPGVTFDFGPTVQRLSLTTSLGAPRLKGANNRAQGNALGISTPVVSSPERAKHEGARRALCRQLSSRHPTLPPFQGLSSEGSLFPGHCPGLNYSRLLMNLPVETVGTRSTASHSLLESGDAVERVPTRAKGAMRQLSVGRLLSCGVRPRRCGQRRALKRWDILDHPSGMTGSGALFPRKPAFAEV